MNEEMKSCTELDRIKQDGFAILRQFYDPHFITDMLAAAQKQFHTAVASGIKPFKALGSLLPITENEDYASAINNPLHKELLAKWGFERPRFSGGYAVTKPPHTPPSAWHQDWWGWNDPLSYTPFIHQLGFLIYLQDTRLENGCLRVIPGSHRKYLPLHAELTKTERMALREYENPHHAAFQYADDEIDVAVNAGDLVVIDARVLHATHPNTSEHFRSMLVLWYYPEYPSKHVQNTYEQNQEQALWHPKRL